MRSHVISAAGIEQRIFYIRGRKVLINRDLAQLYRVSTKRLNEQVRRNAKRFTNDSMFALTPQEKERVVAKCDHLRVLKFSYRLPFVFIEQGIAMISTVLNSERAIQVNIAIMRAFVKLREILAAHKELADRLAQLERRMDNKDQEIMELCDMIRKLMAPPPDPPRRPIG